jgi:hypothetical protein
MDELATLSVTTYYLYLPRRSSIHSAFLKPPSPGFIAWYATTAPPQPRLAHPRACRMPCDDVCACDGVCGVCRVPRLQERHRLVLSESLFVVRENSPLAAAARGYLTQIHGEHFFNSSGWLVQSKVYAH